MSLAFLAVVLFAWGMSLSTAANAAGAAHASNGHGHGAALMMIVSHEAEAFLDAATTPAFKCHDASSEAACTAGTEQGVACLWTPPPRGCVTPWALCANMSSAVEICMTLPQCAFNFVLEVCTVNCDLINDAAYCATNSYCTHYPAPNSPVCGPRCYFAYYDELQCDADPNCFWNARECHELPQQCLMATSESQCVANPLCAWNTSAGLCDFGCLIAQSPGACAARSPEHCTWDFENNECLAQLPPLPPGPVPNPVCQYFTTEAQCAAQGHHCKWDTALLRCRIFSQNEIFCAAIANLTDCQAQRLCQWIDGSCNVLCQVVENEDACAAVVSCEWRNAQCAHTCAYNTYAAVCLDNPGCVWNAAISICLPSCSLAASPSNCTQIPMCAFTDHGECVVGCKWPMNASQCATWPSPHPATTRCEWSESFGVCEEVPLTPAPTTPSPSPVSAHFLQIQCNNSGCAMPGCFSQRFPQNRCLGLQGQNASARVSCVRSSSGVAIALNFTVYESSTRCGGSNVASHLVLVDTCAANSAGGDFLEFKC